MSSRLPLDEIRRVVLLNLDEKEWRTATEYHAAFKAKGRALHSENWYGIALVLERLANDGVAEIRVVGRKRSFRRTA